MKLFTLITVSLGLAVAAYGAATDVLILGYDYTNETDPVKAAFEADAFFGTVVAVEGDPTGQIPSVATLDGYGGVIVWNNMFFDDPEKVEIGDNLADYVDNGGHVSLTVWSVDQIWGRMDTDPAYNPIDGGSNDHANTDLGTVYIPTHPLMYGVTTITGINYKQLGTLESGATLVCDNTKPQWMGAVNATCDVSAINICPKASHSWSGDGYKYIVNSLKCLMIAPSDFDLLTPADGTVIAVPEKSGSSENVKTSLANRDTVIIQPVSGGKATENVDFTWAATTSIGGGAITYTWECDDNADFSSPEHTAPGLTATNHTEGFTVTEDETWYWRVTAIESNIGGYKYCNDVFEFGFDFIVGVESASVGEIKANFK